MAKDDTVTEFVAELLKKERKGARKVRKELSSDPTLAPSEALHEFFSDPLGDLDQWSNLPAVDLRHYLLIGMPAVFDVYPDADPRAFEERTKITIPLAEEMVERRLLIPNLYVRKPQKWRGKEHLVGLLKSPHLAANGVRVDEWFTALNPDYKGFVSRKKKFFEKFVRGQWRSLSAGDRTAILRETRRREKKDIPVPSAHQWGYVETLNQSASGEIEEYFKKGHYVEAFQALRGAKKLMADPLTAAVGGSVVRGREELRWISLGRLRLKTRDSGGVETEDEFIESLEKALLYPQEVMQYVLMRVARVKPLSVLRRVDARDLMRILDDERLSDLRMRLHKTMRILTVSSLKEGPQWEPAPTIGQLEEIVEEFRGRLEDYQGKHRERVEYCVGPLFGGALGSICGSPVEGAALGIAFSEGFTRLFWSLSSREESAAKVFKKLNADQHLVLDTLEQLERMSHGRGVR